MNRKKEELNNTTKTKKMTIEEYSTLYSKPESFKKTKTYLYMLTAMVGIVIFATLFFFVKEMFEINEIAGYISAVLSLILYVVFFIIPVIKVTKTKAFKTNVKKANAKEAQRYNKQLREEIADKIIEITNKTDIIGWYSDSAVGKLAIARHQNDNEGLKKALKEIYENDVKKASNKIIRDHAIRVGITTAISQSEKLDTAFVAIYELNLIKELVYLYGYRPSDTKMLKIYKTVLMNALIAYGLDSALGGVSTGIAKKLGNMGKGIPVLGSIIGTVVESASQGVIDASLTVVIGFQTKKYLKNEFGLQDLLDSIDVSPEDDEKEEENLIKDVNKNITSTQKKEDNNNPNQ